MSVFAKIFETASGSILLAWAGLYWSRRHERDVPFNIYKGVAFPPPEDDGWSLNRALNNEYGYIHGPIFLTSSDECDWQVKVDGKILVLDGVEKRRVYRYKAAIRDRLNERDDLRKADSSALALMKAAEYDHEARKKS